jgi:uncharacterized protein DUF695
MEDRWLYMEGTRAGKPYTASLSIPFDRSRWPGLDQHVALTLGYRAQRGNGLPRPDDLPRLQDLEESLIERLEGHGALVASESSAGARTLHMYLRAECPLALYFGRRADATVTHDPHWLRVVHLSAVASRRAA